MASYEWPESGSGSGGGGVTSLNTLTGDLTLAAGTNITITPSGGNTLTIAATGGGGGGITSINADTTAAQLITSASPTNLGIVTTSGNTVLTLTGASIVEATSSVLTITGATNAVLGTGVSIQVKLASTSQSGYISSTDWNTFNGKQASGNYITALTGDGTASGPGSAALTLATVNSNVGSFGDATHVSAITVNGKGLVTAAASTSIQIAESQVTNLVSDLAAKQSTTLTNTHILVGNGSAVATDVALSGDATLANTGALTLATVASSGTTGSSTSIPSITINAKGLVTSVSGNAVIAPAGTLTGTTLASNVVTSSLTTVGTITSGTWTGTSIAIANGGTGQTSASAAFNALSPMTTSGDIIYGGISGTGTRLPKGTDGQYLQLASGVPSWNNGTSLAAEYLTADTSNGVGSTGNRMKKFTNHSSSTSSMTWVSDSVNGDHINVTANGTYSIYFSWDATSGPDQMGVMKNASGSTTTNPYSQSTSIILAIARTGVIGSPGNCSWTGPLSNGDSVWFNQGASTDGNTALGLVRASRIA